MLMNIPVISPIDIDLGQPAIRRLPAPPDYEIHPLAPVPELTEEARKDPAIVALDEMEHATQISEYHDFAWWDERLQLIRVRLNSVE